MSYIAKKIFQTGEGDVEKKFLLFNHFALAFKESEAEESKFKKLAYTSVVDP